VREVLTYFLAGKEVSEREKLLLRNLSDVEMTMVMLGNVKVQASGLGKMTAKKGGQAKHKEPKEKAKENKPKQQDKGKKTNKKK
jgi:hypothetical protein